MKPVIETTIFNTKEDGRGQVIADLLAYQTELEIFSPIDAYLVSEIINTLMDLEMEKSPWQYEITIFSGDINKIKVIDDPNLYYFQGVSIVIKLNHLSGAR